MNLRHTEPSFGLPCHWTWGYVQSQRLKFAAGSVDTAPHKNLNLQNLMKNSGIAWNHEWIMMRSILILSLHWFAAMHMFTPRLQPRCSQVEAFPTKTFSHSAPEKWRSWSELLQSLLCPEHCRGTMTNYEEHVPHECRTVECWSNQVQKPFVFCHASSILFVACVTHVFHSDSSGSYASASLVNAITHITLHHRQQMTTSSLFSRSFNWFQCVQYCSMPTIARHQKDSETLWTLKSEAIIWHTLTHRQIWHKKHPGRRIDSKTFNT